MCASPLMNPLVRPVRCTNKKSCIETSLSLYSVFALHVKDRHPGLETFMSKDFIVVADISAVNLIVLSKSFTFQIKLSILPLIPFRREKTSSMYLFPTSVSVLWLGLCLGSRSLLLPWRCWQRPQPLLYPLLYYGFVGIFFHETGTNSLGVWDRAFFLSRTL